jgi:hypothetical protein
MTQLHKKSLITTVYSTLKIPEDSLQCIKDWDENIEGNGKVRALLKN